MRLYQSEKIPTTPDQLTIAEWDGIAIDPQRRLSLGIVDNYNAIFNEFELHVWALENDNPVHPNGQREVPVYIPNNSNIGPNYFISYRNILHNPGNAPKQTRKVVPLTIGPSIFVTITNQNLSSLLDEIAPETDTTGFTTNDYYEHIIRDGGGGPQVRELLIDGRDLGY